MSRAKERSNQEQSSLKQQQKQQINLDINMNQHHKYNQNNIKIRKKRGNNTPMFVYQVQINLSYIWGREQLSNPDPKRLEEINLHAHKEHILIPTHFFNSLKPTINPINHHQSIYFSMLCLCTTLFFPLSFLSWSNSFFIFFLYLITFLSFHEGRNENPVTWNHYHPIFF